MLRWLLRLFFRLLYNEFAWTYDLVSWVVSIGQWRAWQRQTIPFLTGDKILEIAHGTGDLQIDLLAKGYRPIAFDLSPHMGHIAQRKLSRRKLSPPFVRGMVQHLPFPNDHFTSLVSTFPTEFIVDPQAITEFQRVLVRGGRLVCVPSANIVPAHVADQFAKWLFAVTGQAGGETVLWENWWRQRYEAAGFAIQIERVNLPRSIVWVVMAIKL